MAYGLNEAITTFEETNNDNFYLHKKKIISDNVGNKYDGWWINGLINIEYEIITKINKSCKISLSLRQL